MHTDNRILFSPVLILLFVSFTHAATITGTVKGPDGAPFMGAFVQAQNTNTRILISVLSNKLGRYRVDNLPAGEYNVRIRAVGYKSDPQNGVQLTGSQNASYDFSLQKGIVRWSDISLYQGEKLFPEGRGKEVYFRPAGCTACHGFESRMASVTRDADGYKDRIQYMRQSMGFFLAKRFTDQDAADVASYLTSLFGPDSILPKSAADMPGYKEVEHPAFSDDAMKIVYVEYDLPTPSSMPWSAVPYDGMIWIPLWARGKIARMDPKTGKVEEWSVPYQGPFNAAIHSAVPAPDGSVWIAEQGSKLLARWDPVTQKITEFNDGENGKHTVRIGPTGEIWFSGTRGSYDPKTGKFTHYGGDAYGIALDRHGNAWYASGDDLVRVDGETRKVTKYTPPTHSDNFNRRIQVDTDGTVWFAEFNKGKLTSFDPTTEKFQEYQLPGPDPTPYALVIDKDHYLWYASEWTDVIGRLDPKTGQVLEYPFDHSENTMREFFIDSQGRTWYATPANNKVGYFYLAETREDVSK